MCGCAVIALASVACSARTVSVGDAGLSDSSSTSQRPEMYATTGGSRRPTGSSGTTSSATSAGVDGASTGAVACIPTVGYHNCDLIEQNCPTGEKCVPDRIVEAAAWDGTNCVPLADDPLPDGSACMEYQEGGDPCGFGSTCYPGGGTVFTGICKRLCDDDEMCAEPGEGCHHFAPAYCFAVCLEPCFPMISDCDALGITYPMSCLPADGAFFCTFLDSTVDDEEGEGCYFRSCAQGLFCHGAEADIWGDPGVCRAYCELGDPNSCDGGALGTCVPLELGGDAYSYLGYCNP